MFDFTVNLSILILHSIIIFLQLYGLMMLQVR